MDAPTLQAQCYAVIDQVVATGRSVLITKDGKPLARLRPRQPDPAPPSQTPVKAANSV